MKPECKLCKLYVVVLCLVANSLTIFGQIRSYSCDFEDDAENGLWTVNSGVFGEDCVSRWYIGSAANNGGKNGFYVSADDGVTAGYVSSALVAVSYRTLTLEAGKYELGMDWSAGVSRANDFYVCWMPDTVKKVNSNINGHLPEWVGRYALVFGDTIALTSAKWHVGCDTIESDGTPCRLVFVWKNTVEDVVSPGACIDNIDIRPLGGCEKPRNISVTSEADGAIISWQGSADSYDLRFKTSSDGVWNEHNGIAGTSLSVADCGEGVVDVYVRSRCGDKTSLWTSYSKFFYVPGMRCIEYLDLNSKNCFYGDDGNPRLFRGVVDYGYDNIFSRHTIHYEPLERDTRTDNGLKTVPDGEIASVRLGNWDIDYHAESVEYKYVVDARMASILLLNYAVVLENPRHDKEKQPRFTLSILKDGKPLDSYGCGEADFSAGYTNDNWNKAQDGKVEWKDWTTVGINLAQYDGDTLTIRLATYDCAEGGHYGYAYFTLGCSDGKIQGLSCGDTPTTEFRAPVGFNYEWYLADKSDDILSTEQIFEVLPNDTFVYYCNVIQPTNTDCYYTIMATAMPRWPIADAGYEVDSRDCKYTVSFTNTSYIKLVNQITKDTTILNQLCESAHWDFGDGTASDEYNPIHEFPGDGGKYTVTLSSGLANDLCLSTYSFTVDLPALTEGVDTVYAYVCKGTPYEFHGTDLYSTGCYSDTAVSPVTGCKTIDVLNLTVVERTDTVVSDTICSVDLPYVFNGVEYNSGGTYPVMLKNFVDCDSVVTLELYVNESLLIDIPDRIEVCADEPEIHIPFSVESGAVSSCIVQCDAVPDLNPEVGGDMVKIPMPKGICPNVYNFDMTFVNMECGDFQQTIDIYVLYSDSIIVQRWNDVLGVCNDTFNGGYEFVAYQWYKDGQPVEGAISSILYADGGLVEGAQYSVALTRAGDGVMAFTCAKDVQYFPSIDEEPMVVVFGNTATVTSDVAGVARLLTVSGVSVGEYVLRDGYTDIRFDVPVGVYILEMTMENGISGREKIIVGKR